MIELIIGIAIGVALMVVLNRRTYGTLRVYVPDDPTEESFLYVELKDKDGVNVICKKKYVRFKVNMRDI